MNLKRLVLAAMVGLTAATAVAADPWTQVGSSADRRARATSSDHVAGETDVISSEGDAGGASASASSDACEPAWVPTFGPHPGVSGSLPGSNNALPSVNAIAMFDDGTGGGPATYAAGRFTSAGGVPANCIAKWDGTRWSALGSGLNEEVFALAVFDDGSGPALFAGGLFTSAGGSPALRLAKWDGSAWSDVGGGVAGGTDPVRVAALAVYDAGEGEELYVGGQFATAGGVASQGIARWNGRVWNSVGGGVGGGPTARVLALVTVDSEGVVPPGLYAGGAFANAGGEPASYIARWDGRTWTALGAGVDLTVNAITVFDDGFGDAIYAGGKFTTAGGIPASRVARWDGTSWAALGVGVNTEVFALAAADDDSGSALHVGGTFNTAGGAAAKYLARWDGSAWTSVGQGMDHWVRMLAVVDLGQGPRLVSGGYFGMAGGTLVRHVATWNGTAWQPFGTGLISGTVFCLESHVDRDATPVMYAGGFFGTSGDQQASNIAQWDGTLWSALGEGVGGSGVTSLVLALTHFDDGSGSDLYAGGWFTTAGAVQANNIARWDGQAWSALGGGLGSAGPFEGVFALATFESATGSQLVAGGNFTQRAGAPANFVATWDGSAWSSLGEGVGGDTPVVVAIEQFDDGVEAALYVAGSFTTAGGHATSNIARWNGTAWSALGSGVDGGVRDLIVFDDGSGPALFVGGSFVSAGGLATTGVARWDGSAWTAIGSGIPGNVWSFAIYDDGTGAAIFAGVAYPGELPPRSGIYKWDGTVWTPLSPNIAGSIHALLPFDDGLGAGPGLIVGGSFTTSPAGDSVLARWQGCPPELCPGDLDGNGSIDTADLAALLGAWSTPAADLDGDGVTGASDLAILLGGWGQCQ